LRIIQSVTIQFLRYKFTGWPVSDALEIFKGIGHPSTYSIFTTYRLSGRDNSTRHAPPGRYSTF